jgi:hypothetical protein
LLGSLVRGRVRAVEGASFLSVWISKFLFSPFFLFLVLLSTLSSYHRHSILERWPAHLRNGDGGKRRGRLLPLSPCSSWCDGSTVSWIRRDVRYYVGLWVSFLFSYRYPLSVFVCYSISRKSSPAKGRDETRRIRTAFLLDAFLLDVRIVRLRMLLDWNQPLIPSLIGLRRVRRSLDSYLAFVPGFPYHFPSPFSTSCCGETGITLGTTRPRMRALFWRQRDPHGYAVGSRFVGFVAAIRYLWMIHIGALSASRRGRGRRWPGPLFFVAPSRLRFVTRS